MLPKLATAVAAGVLTFSPLAHAGPAVLDPGTGTLRDLNPSNNFGTVGFAFTLSSNQQATMLGFYDQGNDGLGVDHQVGLWDAGGTLLGSVTVPSGTGGTLILANNGEGYRYVTLSTPIALTTGVTYTLGAQVTAPAGTDQWRDSGSTAVFGPEIATTDQRFVQAGTGGFSRPTDGGDGFGSTTTGYMAPNMILVPEPSTLFLLGTGLAGLGLRRRR